MVIPFLCFGQTQSGGSLVMVGEMQSKWYWFVHKEQEDSWVPIKPHIAQDEEGPSLEVSGQNNKLYFY